LPRIASGCTAEEEENIVPYPPYCAPVATEEELIQLGRVFQRSRILLTAYELGIFTELGDQQKSAADVAAARSTDPRATDRLMNALVVLGLLEKKDGLFANTSLARAHLVAGQPGYFTQFAHTNSLWDRWSTLTAAVRNGGTVSRPIVGDCGDDRRTAFITAMHHFGRDRAKAVADALDVTNVLRILDVGGASGVYTMELLRKNPEASGAVFDRPEVIPMTRQYIEEAGMTERLSLFPGDFLTTDFGDGYDMVLLFSIVHMLSPDDSRKLVTKCVNALNPGGQLIIKEFVVEDDRTGPPDAVLFALNMLVGTEQGDSYTEAELFDWMKQAGLSRLSRIEPLPGNSLLIGHRD
jgi:2-polyprenyl-3-methyl-5-hydroxy-6-metoxy-1,4-benzoquinol methylase